MGSQDMGGEDYNEYEDSPSPKQQTNNKQWVDTTNSGSKLPQLPQADKRPFDVDAKKPLKDVLKK